MEKSRFVQVNHLEIVDSFLHSSLLSLYFNGFIATLYTFPVI
jgi:hypothetical protein